MEGSCTAAGAAFLAQRDVPLRAVKEPWMAEQAPPPNINSTQAAGVAPAAGASGGAGGAVADAISAAAQTARAISKEATGAIELPDFASPAASNGAGSLDLGLLDDVSLRVKVELGRTQMYVEDVLRLNTSSVVELDKAAGDPVDIYVNDRHVARGEVLVLNENFCVRISEIIPQTVGGKHT